MPTQLDRRVTPSLPLLLLVACCGLFLTGCITGERPVLEPVPVIDDEAAELVLERLQRSGDVGFTATYDIVPSTTGETTTATVRQVEGRRRITIGVVDYLFNGEAEITCRSDTGECVDFIDDAQVSNLNLTHRFWGDGIATRLTIDAARRVGFSEGHTETIAGRPAACADVPVLGGVVVYCALDVGVLGRYFNADVSIELTSYSNNVDPESLTFETDPQI